MKKRLRFIVNPVSGVGKQKAIERLVKAQLDHAVFNAEISYTEGPKHATELAREAANLGYDAVAAVGGDGSVNEVGAGLLGSDTGLAIVPAGSGNGLARQLGIALHLKGAIETINHFRIRAIDSGQVNKRPFFVTAGVGFDAHIGWKFSRRKKRGLGAYMQLVLREYRSYSPLYYALTVDGQRLEREAFLICIANAAQYGNNAKIAPSARLDDGLLDVCVLQKASAVHAPRLIRQLFNGTLERSKFTEYLQGKEITLSQTGEHMHLDGEPLKGGGELAVSVLPQSLKVVAS